LYRADWAEVENINDLNFIGVPEKLSEIYEPELGNDIFTGMTGLEFIYTSGSRGLSVEHQNKIIDLVDGRGMYSSSRKINVKWKDIRNLINDLKTNPNVKSLIGNQLAEHLIQL
jgi:hypothetical protein